MRSTESARALELSPNRSHTPSASYRCPVLHPHSQVAASVSSQSIALGMAVFDNGSLVGWGQDKDGRISSAVAAFASQQSGGIDIALPVAAPQAPCGVRPPEEGRACCGVRPPEEGSACCGVRPPEEGSACCGVRPPEEGSACCGVRPPEEGSACCGPPRPPAGAGRPHPLLLAAARAAAAHGGRGAWRATAAAGAGR
jgi:hypothetical protein